MLKFEVEGMSCEHCVKAVTQATLKVPGVASVREVSLERHEAVIDGSPAPEKVIEAIQRQGYTARAKLES